MFKIKGLRGQLTVNETQKVNLRGIHEDTIQTMGKLLLPIELNGRSL